RSSASWPTSSGRPFGYLRPHDRDLSNPAETTCQTTSVLVWHVRGDMKPGEILVEGASRRFRVYEHQTRTLKELILKRGRLGGEDFWALRDVSVAIEPGEAV